MDIAYEYFLPLSRNRKIRKLLTISKTGDSETGFNMRNVANFNEYGRKSKSSDQRIPKIGGSMTALHRRLNFHEDLVLNYNFLFD